MKYRSTKTYNITGITNKEKFEYDKEKRNFAERQGFKVLVCRDDCPSSIEESIKRFIRKVKEQW